MSSSFQPQPESSARAPLRPAGDADSLAEDLTKVGQRDLAALRRVYDATSGKLMAIGLRITGSREAAEDVLQEVYIKVWNRAGGFDRQRAHPLAWLAAIARNSAIDSYRSQARRKAQDLSDVPDVRPQETLPADQALIDQQQEAYALAMVDDLEPLQRNHIKDIYFEGLTYAELADRHGIPLGTVKSRIHRALIALNKRWDRD